MYPTPNLTDRLQRLGKKPVLACFIAVLFLSLLTLSAYADNAVTEHTDAENPQAVGVSDGAGAFNDVPLAEGTNEAETEHVSNPQDSAVESEKADEAASDSQEQEQTETQASKPEESAQLEADTSGLAGATASDIPRIQDVVAEDGSGAMELMGNNGNHDITSWMQDFGSFIIPPDGDIPQDPAAATAEFLETVKNNSTFRMLFQFNVVAPDGLTLEEGDFIQIRYAADPPEYVAFGEFKNVSFYANGRIIGNFSIVKDENTGEMVLTLTFNNLVNTKTKIENCNIVTSNNNAFETDKETTTTITIGDVEFTIVLPEPGPPTPGPGLQPNKTDISKSAWVPAEFNGSQVDEDGNNIFKAWWTVESGADLNDFLIQNQGIPDPALNLTEYYIEDEIAVGQGAKDIDASSFSFVGLIPYIRTVEGVDYAAKYNYSNLGSVAFDFTSIDQGNMTYEEFKSQVLAAPAQYGVYQHAVDANTPATAPKFTVLVNFGSPTAAENVAAGSAYPKHTQQAIVNAAAASSYFKAKYPTYTGAALENALKNDPEVKKLVAALVSNDIGGNMLNFRFTFLASYDQPTTDEGFKKENKAIRYLTEETETGTGTATFKKAAGFGELEKSRAYLEKSDANTGDAIEGASFKLMKYNDTVLDWEDYNHPLLVTDEWGVAISDVLENGRYKFVEVGAALGYDPDSAVFSPEEFTITEQDFQGVQVVCTNEKDVSSLEVLKTVDDPGGITTGAEEYTFVLTKNGQPAAEQAYTLTKADGSTVPLETDSDGRFILLLDEKATFDGLAVGDIFTVEEVDRPMINEVPPVTVHTVDGVPGEDFLKTKDISIQHGIVSRVIYVNGYEENPPLGGGEGLLKVTKQVEDPQGFTDADKVYSFVITDDKNAPLGDRTYILEGSFLQTGGDGSFTMKAGQMVEFPELPIGAKYIVAELGASRDVAGAAATTIVTVGNNAPTIGLSTAAIQLDESEAGTLVTFQNGYTPEARPGMLSVVKYTAGNAVPKNATFTFELSQGGVPVEGATYSVGTATNFTTGSDGRFSLQSGQVAVFSNLALDVEYMMKEVDRPSVAGVTATTSNTVAGVTGASGLTTDGFTVTGASGVDVAYSNGYTEKSGSNPSGKSPATGDLLLDLAFGVGALAGTSALASYLHGTRRRRQG